MKLKKNDYLELRKAGLAAIQSKMTELRLEYGKLRELKMKNELKNFREPAIVRRAIAKLMTIAGQLKESK
jgi:ribosomal protein L29